MKPANSPAATTGTAKGPRGARAIAAASNHAERVPAGEATAAQCRLSLRVRSILSALLLFHVAVIYIGPFSIGPTSILGETLRRWFRPYLQMIATHYQGYKFFDEPGPSHRMRYELEFADGTKKSGVFPNLKEHWPRLLYHRHFMLTESHYSQAVPKTPPPGVRPGEEAYNAWKRWREATGELGDALLDSYAHHLLAANGAQHVTIWGLERNYPPMEDVLAGVPLEDSRYLAEPILLGSWEAQP